MPRTACTCAAARLAPPRPQAVVDAEIRQLAAGRDAPADWDADALAELAVLRAEWLAAKPELAA